ncbi:MAG: hypothetical protein ACLFR1_02980 [Spirochaetia bacterium]
MKKTVLFFVVIIILTFVSCAVTVDQVKENPQQFAGETISVSGRVYNVVQVPLTDFSVYLFGNEESKVAVFTSQSRSEGENLSITAKVVASPTEDASEDVENAVQEVKNYLVANELAQGRVADRISRGIVEVARRTASTLGQMFFLIEQ